MRAQQRELFGFALVGVFGLVAWFFAWPDYERLTDMGIGGTIALALTQCYHFSTRLE